VRRPAQRSSAQIEVPPSASREQTQRRALGGSHGPHVHSASNSLQSSTILERAGRELCAIPNSECLTALTVGDLAKEFSQRNLQRERKHPREAEFTIQTNILRYWRSRPAASVTRRDGVLLLDRIVDRNAPVMANRVAALLSQMFRFGVERGMLEASPFISMPRPGGTEKGRRRKLDEREVPIFWKKLTRSSLMTASGVPRLHVEKVLNHTIDDVAEITQGTIDPRLRRASGPTSGRRQARLNSCAGSAPSLPRGRSRVHHGANVTVL
jgi:Phage integrase central domain